jgi:hypothetical protein
MRRLNPDELVVASFETVAGGYQYQVDTVKTDPNDPTEQTHCFVCPPDSDLC